VRLSTPEPESLARLLAALEVDHLCTIIEGKASVSFALNGPQGIVILD